MRDYFREFLIPTQSRLGATSAGPPETKSAKAKTPMKTHIMWAVGGIGLSALAWKASKWHTIITSSTNK